MILHPLIHMEKKNLLIIIQILTQHMIQKIVVKIVKKI
jgi:hypothetical protein